MAIYRNGNSYSDTPSVGSQELVESFGRLVKPAPADKRLPGAETPPAIRAKTGTQPRSAGAVDTAVVTVQSTDGLFSFTVTVLK